MLLLVCDLHIGTMRGTIAAAAARSTEPFVNVRYRIGVKPSATAASAEEQIEIAVARELATRTDWTLPEP